MIAVVMVIVTMEYVNVLKDLKEIIVQLFQDLKKDAKIHVFLNVYKFVRMFIK